MPCLLFGPNWRPYLCVDRNVLCSLVSEDHCTKVTQKCSRKTSASPSYPWNSWGKLKSYSFSVEPDVANEIWTVVGPRVTVIFLDPSEWCYAMIAALSLLERQQRGLLTLSWYSLNTVGDRAMSLLYHFYSFSIFSIYSIDKNIQLLSGKKVIGFQAWEHMWKFLKLKSLSGTPPLLFLLLLL